ERLLQALAEHPAVEEPGQRIVAREELQAVLGLHAADELADVAAHPLRHCQHLLVARAQRAAEELQLPVYFAPDRERKREGRAQARFRGSRAAHERRVLRDVRDPYRSTSRPHCAVQSPRRGEIQADRALTAKGLYRRLGNAPAFGAAQHPLLALED